MEDYKKLYEDLVDRIKTMAKAQPLGTKEAIEMHFPEIVESEDERIRKELIAEVKEQIDCIPAPDCRDKEDEKALKRLGKWLTWLEKYKEEDSYAHRKTQEFMEGFKRVQCYEELSEWEKMFDNIASKYANRKNDEGYNNSWFVKERAGDMLYYAKKELEKQGKKEPVVFIPKFRVGDIVKSKSQPMLSPRKIISIGNDCYRCEDRGCIGFAWEDDFEIIDQNSVWSEWDEKIYNLLYKEYKNLAYYSHSREKAEDIPGEVLGWLKALKNRCTWKPSQEQMEAFYIYIYQPQYINNSDDERIKLVESLYKDLKKFMEE